MHRDCTVIPPIESIPVKKGIVVLRGYGLIVHVEHGRLLLQDGVAKNRRQGKFTKATSGLKRLVLLGHSGTISFEALRWLHDIGAAIVQIDADGRLLLASSPFKETYSHLRRAQALASGDDMGLKIVRDLLKAKLDGQAHFALRRSRAVAEAIEALSNQLDHEIASERLRLVEAQAASLYWSTWTDAEMRFSRQDKHKIPKHWKTFAKRVSSITGSPRNASNPANALLNYLYAILEAESRIALLTVGLDPGMGLLHADQTSRDSMALDLMEAVRPRVDAWLFEFGWFGGGDAQLAFGLVALGRDWWILAYLFGGTIILGFAVMFRRHGFGGGLKRSWWVFRNLNSPDEEAIKFPWAVLASAGGLAYMWVFPGLT